MSIVELHEMLTEQGKEICRLRADIAERDKLISDLKKRLVESLKKRLVESWMWSEPMDEYD